MTWRIENACSIHARCVDGLDVLTINLSEQALLGVSVGLCMLKEGVIANLDLVDTQGKRVARISSQAEVGASVQNFGRERVLLSIDPVCLDAWMCFTLRAVRDGVAEVDHLDLDANDHANEREVYVVLKFPFSVSPLSEDEARGRLGI